MLFASVALAADRKLLWHVVQTCVINHKIFGIAFPCLTIHQDPHEDNGFAVLKAPFETTHIIVTPIVPISGIESPKLLEESAPNYVQDAWEARHFVAESLGRPIAWDNFGLAVNSISGRSQDQLHIHVDCVLPEVRAYLRQSFNQMHSDKWVHLKEPMHGNRYWVLFLDKPDLSNINIFKLAVSGLHIMLMQQGDLSLALIGARISDSQTGFYLLADLTSGNKPMGAHAEFLLDHSCTGHEPARSR